MSLSVLEPTSRSQIIRNSHLDRDGLIHLLGIFSDRVTVFCQQVRALNLAGALVEEGLLDAADGERRKIGIIGAGFAGLTLAAALIAKSKHLDITLFEERDRLIPLQQGSDSRWLHPHIYDWPDGDSDASAAMLPVLNWTAGRASDVVVQTLSEWRRHLRKYAPEENSAGLSKVRLYCHVRHIEVQKDGCSKVRIEWVGETREASTGAIPTSGMLAAGCAELFDRVILAVGFGLEREAGESYWRNETIAQPSLARPRRTFLVSGQGDGAMIDLLRLRVSQFRQDRVLDELFQNQPFLVGRLKKLKADLAETGETDLFARFEELYADSKMAPLLEIVRAELAKRLRRDTDAVLHLKSPGTMAALFDTKRSKISFQNAFLVYLLYRCGGFAPSVETEKALCAQYGIGKDAIIRRHGTDRLGQLRRLLSAELFAELSTDFQKLQQDFMQPAAIAWRGGYFGFPGKWKERHKQPDEVRDHWRREYLPGPTALLATAIAGQVAGLLAQWFPTANDVRVTLHRTLWLNDEALLQQACPYAGNKPDRKGSAGRTFAAAMGTIGLAYRSHAIVRSVKDAAPADIEAAMAMLDLAEGAKKMRKNVRFLLAIPILQPECCYYGDGLCCGVLYLDSTDEQVFLDDRQVAQLSAMLDRAVMALADDRDHRLNRVRNVKLSDPKTETPPPEAPPNGIESAIQTLRMAPPRVADAFHFNFDYNDLTPPSDGADDV